MKERRLQSFQKSYDIKKHSIGEWSDEQVSPRIKDYQENSLTTRTWRSWKGYNYVPKNMYSFYLE